MSEPPARAAACRSRIGDVMAEIIKLADRFPPARNPGEKFRNVWNRYTGPSNIHLLKDLRSGQEVRTALRGSLMAALPEHHARRDEIETLLDAGIDEVFKPVTGLPIGMDPDEAWKRNFERRASRLLDLCTSLIERDSDKDALAFPGSRDAADVTVLTRLSEIFAKRFEELVDEMDAPAFAAMTASAIIKHGDRVKSELIHMIPPQHVNYPLIFDHLKDGINGAFRFVVRECGQDDTPNERIADYFQSHMKSVLMGTMILIRQGGDYAPSSGPSATAWRPGPS